MSLSNHNLSKNIGFIGAGNMAQAIIHGLIANGASESLISCSNPSSSKLDRLHERYPNMFCSNDNQVVVERSEIIVLAVKPQKVEQVLKPLATIDFSTKLVISIAAGVETQTISQLLSQDVSQVRAMPNTPATIGAGATGLFANTQVSDSQLTQAKTIFDSIGTSVWINDEAQMDLVTAIAGSAPAYYFLFLEAVVKSAVQQGMNEQTAKSLAVQTALGASALIAKDLTQDIGSLRQQVTSPAGTTEAAVNSFQSNNFEQIIDEAIKASVQRGQELATIAKSNNK